MKRNMRTLLFVAAAIAVLVAGVTIARAEPQQTRVYDANGRSVGTIVPQGDGTNRYYDSRGSSLGTSTTTGNTTKFYGPRGNVTGTITGPTAPRR
jgi:YD repeat-containing protein